MSGPCHIRTASRSRRPAARSRCGPLCHDRPTAEHDADRGYLLDDRQDEAGVRFSALGELFDPVAFRRVDRLGICVGMRCWEVGAGGPSVSFGLATAPMVPAWGRRP